MTTTLSLSDAAAAAVKADALVLPMVDDGGTAALRPGLDLPKETVRHLNQALDAMGAKVSTGDEIVKIASVPGVKAGLVVLAASTTASVAVEERLRRSAGAAARVLAGVPRAAFGLGDGSAEQSAAVAEGALLGSYAFHTFHGKGKDDSTLAPLGEAVVLGLKPRSRAAKDLITRVTTVADAVRYARDLVNTPPNVLYPESFASSVTRRAKGSKVSIDVWDPKRLSSEGCGGLIGVGQGSARGPRLVTMSYKPSRPVAHLALVGKGITFDSGGLCIKPGPSMVTMKCDMAGAAAVAAAVLALAELGVPVQVTGYLCLAENMTGDLAQRPGDVVTMRGGRTVEIINTDAEGRLVMADGLVLATEQQPDAIVDIATLTGAAVLALGQRTMGVMGNDDGLRDRVHGAAAGVGESSWPMPMPEEIRVTLDSPVADIKHTGERAAGMMVAATFLKEFVRDTSGAPVPWAHVDIAGPAFNEGSAWGYTPKGGTGSGVRALIALAESFAGK